ncbi:hypothetical protein MJD09_00730 [bacterium]|nr:hypothetical protein [bacterium]
MYRLNSSRFKVLVLFGLTLVLLVTLLSCAGDPIVDPRNVDEEDENTKDENEEDPNTGGGLSSTQPLIIPANVQIV